MVKKILKWTGISLLVILILLIATPFLFKDKIKSMVVKAINDQVDATVAFEDVSLSFISNFPQASVTVDKLSVINKAPFAGDTLVYVGELNLNMSVKEIFKGDGEPMNLKSFGIKNTVINILFNKDGVGNFDIARKKAQEEQAANEEPSKPFALNMQEYYVDNLKFRFADERSKINVIIDSLNHKGKGNFAANKLDLDTHTDLNLTVDMDKTNFMRNTKLKLDAVLGLDLDKSIYTFKENKLLINQMGLEFDGSVALLENGQDINLTFKTPESSFKNFLALIPSAYSSSLAGVQTEGNFTVNGKVNGVMDDTHIPKFNVAFLSKNASFQYPNLPKGIKNINIDTKVVNETGVMNDTYVNIDQFAFRIDQDVFDAKANIRNLTENPLVDARLKGTINLGNLTKAYPVKLDVPLSGILKADVETKFDMASVEKGAYEKIDNRGQISLSGFNYKMDGFKNPFVISLAELQFNPSRVSLNRFDAKTGSSDVAISGTLDNFYGFAFKNQTLKGNFNMKSNKLVIADLMTTGTTTTATPAKTEAEGDKKAEAKKPVAASDAVKIPAFLDCTITASANSVVYDNLTLKDFGGKMVIKDEAVAIQNAKTSIFDGNIGFNGLVSTKTATPTFDMDLNLNSLDIPQAFTQLEMLKKIAPIAEVLSGKLNAGIKVGGKLDSKEMTPDMKSLTGNLGGSLANAIIHTDKSKVLQALTGKVKFLDPSKLNLNQKINLTFNDGKVNIQPFVVKYKNQDIKISGTHGFDQQMAYTASVDVPAKEFDQLVDKAATIKVDISKIVVPVNINITGTFQNPKIGTDLDQGIKTAVTQLVKQEKDRVVNEVKEKATEKGKELLGNLLNGKKSGTTTTDSTKTQQNTNTKQQAEEAAKNAGKNLINGLFKKKDKKE